MRTLPHVDDSGLHLMKARSGQGVERAVFFVIHLCIYDGGRIATLCAWARITEQVSDPSQVRCHAINLCFKVELTPCQR